MSEVRRRRVLHLLALAVCAAPMTDATSAVSEEKSYRSLKERWLDEWMASQKAPAGALHLSRFRDPMYFLLTPITWKPDPPYVGKLPAVTVPAGFVTDLASIPRPFWSLLRP